MSKKWEYGEAYKKYDMEGEIEIGTGKVKVHDIFEPLPNFMKEADCIFSDPPCSLSNINTFYTKADKEEEQKFSFTPFENRFFECVDEIKPKKLFLEVFKANRDSFIKKCKERYDNVNVYESMYYHSKKNKCWIIVCSNEELPNYPFEGIDEQNVIEWICQNVDYKCIADPCMGRGLVGFYSNKYNKKFVGTELNKKRLAVLLERINKNKL